MILVITGSCVGTADDLVRIFTARNIPVFRFNTDLFYRYQFLWQGSDWEIIDPLERVCNSREVEIVVMYKCLLHHADSEYAQMVQYPDYAKEIINEWSKCLANWAMDRQKLRLWHPHEYAYPKTRQMEIAQKYFQVPEFSLHWGFRLDPRSVIAKQLVQRQLDDGGLPFAGIADRAQLDPLYPWLTQDVAPGDRDATVLYINGKVHGFQFATARGNLTDWRVTQGTDANRWEKWDAGKEFEQKIDAYMRELGLKFGRFDFIIGGAAPQFLEVNPRGQFGWLDDDQKTLNNEVVDAILDPASTIKI